MNNDYRELSDIVAPAHTAVLVVDMMELLAILVLLMVEEMLMMTLQLMRW